MIEIKLTKKETVLLIAGLKTSEFWNEYKNISERQISESLIKKLNDKLIKEILEEENKKEDNLPF